MADMPKADVVVDAALAERLVADQFPEFAVLPIGEIVGGWDNAVVRLGDALALRIPRRKEAVQLVLNEQRCLPGFAERVSIPIPAPVRIGEPTDYYPWAWSVVPWLDGVALTDLSVVERRALAPELAAFLGELHTEAPADAPENLVRGVPLASRKDVIIERITSPGIPRSAELLEVFERLVPTEPWDRPPVWLHGDLHPGNLLVRAGRLAGVIDFGDVTSGDPASDLAVAWLAFDREGRELFYDALPAHYRADEALLLRATAWGLALGTVFMLHSDDNPAMAAIGTHTLNQVLEWNG